MFVFVCFFFSHGGQTTYIFWKLIIHSCSFSKQHVKTFDFIPVFLTLHKFQLETINWVNFCDPFFVLNGLETTRPGVTGPQITKFWWGHCFYRLVSRSFEGGYIVCPQLSDRFLRHSSYWAGEFLDHYMFQGNCPPTPPPKPALTLDFSVTAKCWLRGGVW